MTDTPQLQVLGFAGSLRKASYNRALLNAAKDLAPDAMNITIFELNDVPIYNGDVEAQGFPASVVEFKQAIARSDALFICTPEYNHGVPGVLKNAIDWASRPPSETPLTNKPVGIVGASPGMLGTVRSQIQVRQALNALGCRILSQPEYFLGQCSEKFDANGTLVDERSRTKLSAYLEALQRWTQQLQK